MKVRQTGFTLIELLVAMLISLVLIFACTSLYSSLKSSITLAQGLATAQESLRGSFYLMSRSVRQAEKYDITGTSGAVLTTTYAPTSNTVYSCLGHTVSSAGGTDTFSLVGGDLSCDDGIANELIALGVSSIYFENITGTNGDGVKVTIKIEGMPDSYASGLSFALALRQKVLLDITN